MTTTHGRPEIFDLIHATIFLAAVAWPLRRWLFAVAIGVVEKCRPRRGFPRCIGGSWLQRCRRRCRCRRRRRHFVATGVVDKCRPRRGCLRRVAGSWLQRRRFHFVAIGVVHKCRPRRVCLRRVRGSWLQRSPNPTAAAQVRRPSSASRVVVLLPWLWFRHRRCPPSRHYACVCPCLWCRHCGCRCRFFFLVSSRLLITVLMC